MTETDNDKKTDILLADYNMKWNYIIHTESIQNKFVQWYFAIVAAVFTVLFSNDSKIDASDQWVPLLFLFIYSFFVKLKILFEKINLRKTYIEIQKIEENFDHFEKGKGKRKSMITLIMNNIMSVFMMIFIPIILVSAGILLLLSQYVQMNESIKTFLFIAYPTIFFLIVLFVMVITDSGRTKAGAA